MMRFSRKTLLALEAVLDVAYNARPDPVQSRDITARLGVPQRYLEQAMQQLVHEGVLKGVRGPRGGYVLARERRRITAGEVVRIVDALERAEEDAEAAASDLGAGVVRPLCRAVQESALAQLDAITMEELCARSADLGVPRADENAPDFTI
ncbi:MAG: Rrf2 family transcriptional regulator [Rhodobacteraceae bacterium]|nr:MAG: Rrf2 family transcriptional regulator [Paracoccaceae bacterium]